MTHLIMVMNFILMFHFSSSNQFFILTHPELQKIVKLEKNNWKSKWDMQPEMLCSVLNEAIVISSIFADKHAVNFSNLLLTDTEIVPHVTTIVLKLNKEYIEFNTVICFWKNKTVHIAQIKEHNYYFLFGYEMNKRRKITNPKLVAVLVKYFEYGEVINMIGAMHFISDENNDSFKFLMHQLCASLIYHFERSRKFTDYNLSITHDDFVNKKQIPDTLCTASYIDKMINYRIHNLKDKVINVIPAGKEAFVMKYVDGKSVYYWQGRFFIDDHYMLLE